MRVHYLDSMNILLLYIPFFPLFLFFSFGNETLLIFFSGCKKNCLSYGGGREGGAHKNLSSHLPLHSVFLFICFFPFSSLFPPPPPFHIHAHFFLALDPSPNPRLRSENENKKTGRNLCASNRSVMTRISRNEGNGAAEIYFSSPILAIGVRSRCASRTRTRGVAKQ